MRARSALLLSLVLSALIGCNRNNTSAGNANPSSADPLNGSATDKQNTDVGPALYSLAGPPAPPQARAGGTEPIVIGQAYVQYEDRQQVSAEVDGKIELIGSPLTKRADGRYVWEQPGETAVVYDPAHPHPSIVFHPRDKAAFPNNKEKWVPYWKLSDGMNVAADQILCLLDDQMVTTKRETAKKIRETSYEVRNHAKDGAELVRKKIKLYENNPGVIPEAQKLDDLTQLSRFLENLAQANQAIAKADQEVAEAEITLEKHQIRSRVDGIIRSVAKHPGEIVRAGEKILEIQSTEKVRLEGMLDIEYERRLKRNMTVTVEPAVPSAPLMTLRGHRQEVGGVAVTGHVDRPLIVSAGLDGFVLVRDPNIGNVKDQPAISHSLPHPVPARAVACTPPSAKSVLVVTGANDGKVRIWDLIDLAKLPTEPKFVPADYHTAAVTALAISPDGKYAASAAGREVFIWDLLAGKRLYSLPPEHRDSVTSLSFTPQGTLITAAKDRTMKVWKLGAERGAVALTVEHRSSAVDLLGVSPDGGRMLFDQDKGRIDLVNVADGQTTGQISGVGANATFGTLALFGPDHGADNALHHTIVTAGGEGDLRGVLQLWQAPKAGGRAAEIARLIAPGRVPVTCAAFSPHKDVPFLAVGTIDGKVHIWTPSSEPARKLEGRITYIDTTDPRYVTVRVEMDNKQFPLRDHTTATVIVNPEQQK
jgi:WD40 repeat protein